MSGWVSGFSGLGRQSAKESTRLCHRHDSREEYNFFQPPGAGTKLRVKRKDHNVQLLQNKMLRLTHPVDELFLVFCPPCLVRSALSPVKFLHLEEPEDTCFESPGVDGSHVSLSSSWVSCRVVSQAGKVFVPQNMVRDAVRVEF